jgi:hypothetical protein
MAISVPVSVVATAGIGGINAAVAVVVDGIAASRIAVGALVSPGVHRRIGIVAVQFRLPAARILRIAIAVTVGISAQKIGNICARRITSIDL